MRGIKNIKNVYFIGIGGIGMSALARYYHAHGADVSGYDKTPTFLTDELQRLGMRIHFEEDIQLIPVDADLVVYTPAIPRDHAELKHCIAQNFTVMKRSEVLGAIARSMFNISVAGSHGKTTVSTMIGHVLKDTGYDCTAFLGGMSVNYNTNMLLGENNLVVVEADEYDRSFLQLYPDIAVVTAVDSDHLDIYGSMDKVEQAFGEFVSQVASDGTLVVKYNLPVADKARCSKVVTYSLYEPEADCYVTGYRVEDGGYVFDVSLNGATYKDFQLQVGGIFNIENALAAITVGQILGLDIEAVREAIASFLGIKRRFQVIYKDEQRVFIDDYAHHPKEIAVLLNSVKEMYPGRRVTVIFQPHLYSRTRDLADEFAASLSAADELYLLDIYPAREEPIAGVSSKLILDPAEVGEKRIILRADLPTILEETGVEVLLTVGAGDIDQLIYPIKKWLENNEKHLA